MVTSGALEPSLSLVIMSLNLKIIVNMVAFGHCSAEESQIAQWKLSCHRRRRHDLLLGTCIVAVSEVFGALGLMCQEFVVLDHRGLVVWRSRA